MKGHIQVILGPMFSGKTTELMRRLKRYQIANYKCLVIKYKFDDRFGSEGIFTHDRQTCSAVAAVRLCEVDPCGYDIIGIDEGQFFPDIVRFSEDMANKGKIVIVAALDGTYQRLPFGEVLSLVPLAESVIKLTAVCMVCYGEASYTKRTSSDQKVEVIGGADKYMAVCRQCYFQTSLIKNEELNKKCSPMKALNYESITNRSSINCENVAKIWL
ncbi:thymidine kinase, cytosolic-like [Schistocerca americana]|uniref:thymidine kinase, cytosolic-like n=1 Tax=Schistocerca americana TaxID=7009 RepID=UPI001F5038E5|nr:thymidine kinase, cytosolic-like [Schistocerca americana]XP_047119794.1 thymidine kinase, cytosolic-like isoform X2 [Schistocerca piceifrons]XP_049835425.1 thymidine kinase, cytosolic-like [Schistocerca gregaria]